MCLNFACNLGMLLETLVLAEYRHPLRFTSLVTKDEGALLPTDGLHDNPAVHNTMA